MVVVVMDSRHKICWALTTCQALFCVLGTRSEGRGQRARPRTAAPCVGERGGRPTRTYTASGQGRKPWGAGGAQDAAVGGGAGKMTSDQAGFMQRPEHTHRAAVKTSRGRVVHTGSRGCSCVTRAHLTRSHGGYWLCDAGVVGPVAQVRLVVWGSARPLWRAVERRLSLECRDVGSRSCSLMQGTSWKVWLAECHKLTLSPTFVMKTSQSYKNAEKT